MRAGDPRRDGQRQRLYNAESAVRDTLPVRGTQFGTVAEIQGYVDRLLRSAWWKRRWPGVTDIEIRSGGGHRRAVAYTKPRWRGDRLAIHLPLWARAEVVVLHEIAHHAHEDRYGDTTSTHGPEFAQIFLELVRHKIGDEAWRTLRASFDEHRVRYRMPRKRTQAQIIKVGLHNIERQAAAVRHRR